MWLLIMSGCCQLMLYVGIVSKKTRLCRWCIENSVWVIFTYVTWCAWINQNKRGKIENKTQECQKLECPDP